ncbi:hypothetical protein PAXRUDRAFT_547218 [Paxillus rubicundulus Ve08.2h10]|uniref:Uncharacterized protein n=1 Tax=Paxillus rubicundulus Ve08.2h10 TaxID=930991 RepID=A0A0D0D7P0_9AGAM|nr:hypothetical protein PAXRUDRAFT_547218 [Paxillus rubicundulus Ve08.2h10]
MSTTSFALTQPEQATNTRSPVTEPTVSTTTANLGTSTSISGTSISSNVTETGSMAGPSANVHVTIHLGKRKRSERGSEVDFDPVVIPQGPKRPAKINEWSLLMKLIGSGVGPGLTAKRVKTLLTKCECGLIMTRGAYDDHDCLLDLGVIDLTGDPDDDSDSDVV